MTTTDITQGTTEYKSTERARKRRKSRRRNWMIIASVVVLVAAGFSYYQFFYLPGQEVAVEAEEEMQTATIRQGDIVLYASGAGELIAPTDATLTFPVTAEITAVSYAVGDEVEAGDVLMTVDTSDLAAANTNALRAFNEIVSPVSIAEARQNAAALEVEVDDAESTLTWLISPLTYYWEEKLEAAQEALSSSQADSDQAAIDEANRLIADAEVGLKQAAYNFENTYLPENFTYEECSGSGRDRTCEEYVSGPTEATIDDARFTLELQEALLAEAQDYLTLITTGDISEDATGSAITNYYNLRDAVESAQENLEAAEMVAPISGVITELIGEVGEESNNTSVTITNLDTLYVEIYLDSSDWDKIDLGYNVEVIFDSLPDTTFNGSVIQVDPFLTNSGGATVIGGLVALEAEDQALIRKLPLGSSAAVEVIGGRAEGVLLVPVESLKEVSEGQYAVLVLDENDEPKLTMVEIGLTDIYYAEVISGLEQGDVVTTGIVETE